MNQDLTIIFQTCRKDSKFEWFIESLSNQVIETDRINVVAVDFYADKVSQMRLGNIPILKTPPKPCVWQGRFRLCKDNYFAPSNSRNGGICYARDGWAAFCDDLAVLMPGWLQFVRQAMTQSYRIYLGAYKKVKNLKVENGIAVSFDEFPSGVDSRWSFGSDAGPVPCTGDYLYGCSFLAPVEALLAVNGFDENCDSCGGEDYCLGIRLFNRGYQFSYARQMLTLESEELHHVEKPFIRLDKGKSPNDRSHALLKMARESDYAPNFFPEGGIRALRQRILAGEDFPICQSPQHDFFDGQPISEM